MKRAKDRISHYVINQWKHPKRLLVFIMVFYVLSMMNMGAIYKFNWSVFHHKTDEGSESVFVTSHWSENGKESNITHIKDMDKSRRADTQHHLIYGPGYNLNLSASQPNYSTLIQRFPTHTDHWQTVIKHKLFVYSAYLDRRDSKEDIVKIIAIAERNRDNKNSTQLCHLWFTDDRPPLVINMDTFIYPEQNRYVINNKKLSFVNYQGSYMYVITQTQTCNQQTGTDTLYGCA